MKELDVHQKCLNYYNIVKERTPDIRKLGNWPDYISDDSLISRIPITPKEKYLGFDAGIACCLDLIPREKQKLSAQLHANYTKEAVDLYREQVDSGLDPNSETCWCLAACSICREGDVTQEIFLEQIDQFKILRDDPNLRRKNALDTQQVMKNSFKTGQYGENVPFGSKDGSIQGAYLSGFKFGTMFIKEVNRFYIGTYFPSLGIPDDFPWSSEVHTDGEPRSGFVFGSKQFVMCATEDEFKQVLEIVNDNFSENKILY